MNKWTIIFINLSIGFHLNLYLTVYLGSFYISIWRPVTTLGLWYLGWRWMCSLNYDALWFSLPLALLSHVLFIGSILFIQPVEA